MIEQAKQNWYEFKHSQPGYRFQERYNRRQETTSGPLDPKNLLYVAAGVLIVALGLALAPVPGPGGFIAFVGLAFLGAEFLPVARLLDWCELRVRGIVMWARNIWRVLPLNMRLVVAVVAVIIALLVVYGGYVLFF